MKALEEHELEDADYERRLEIANELRRRLRDEVGLETLGLLGRALVVGSGPLAQLGWAFQHEAEESEVLAPLVFSVVLADLSWDEELQGRLEAADAKPWRAVLAAVRALSDLRVAG